MTRRPLYALAGGLAVAGLGMFSYKWLALGFPLRPDAERKIWTVQARFEVDAHAGPVKAVLQIPLDPPGFSLLDESFVSRGYGLTTHVDGEAREAWWAIRRARGRQALYYRALFVYDGSRPRATEPPEPPRSSPLEEPFETARTALLSEVRSRSADVASLTAGLLKRLADPSPDEYVDLFLAAGRSPARRARIAVDLLSAARVPARVAYGLELGEVRRHASFTPWLEVHDGKRWLFFDPETGNQGLPPDFLVWWRGDRPLIRAEGADNPEVEVSVRGSVGEALEVAERRAESRGSRLVEFSLLGLPLQTQSVYAVMLLIPIGALLMVLLRNVVGIKTFGTFTPILVALAFRETRLLWGIVLFTAVVTLGLGLRFLLEKLHLLMVPRLAAVLTLVVVVMAAISVLSQNLGLETGLSVALFPLVILTMAIERLSIVWEERGAGEALQEGLGSLVVAAVGYLVMSLDQVEHLVLVFPELLLVVLAAILLLGRYRGYRLLELTRFRELA